MSKNYAMVAQQARIWSMDALLPPGKRMLARSLSELAEMLSDPQYGCPSEHYAADVMYCKLCRFVSADPTAAELAGSGGPDCPYACKALH